MIMNLPFKTVVMIKHLAHFLSGFPGDSVVKNLPAGIFLIQGSNFYH